MSVGPHEVTLAENRILMLSDDSRGSKVVRFHDNTLPAISGSQSSPLTCEVFPMYPRLGESVSVTKISSRLLQLPLFWMVQLKVRISPNVALIVFTHSSPSQTFLVTLMLGTEGVGVGVGIGVGVGDAVGVGVGIVSLSNPPVRAIIRTTTMITVTAITPIRAILMTCFRFYILVNDTIGRIACQWCGLL